MSKQYLLPPELGVISSMAAAVDEDGEIGKLNAVEMIEEDGSITYNATNGFAAISVTRKKTALPEIARYPNIEAVIPKTEPIFVVKVDAKKLRDLLLVVQSLGICFDEAAIEWHGVNKPCVIRAGNGETEMVGLIMPRKKAK